MQKLHPAALFLLFTCTAYSQATLVKDINPGSANGAPQTLESYIAYNGKLYFSGNDGQNGGELWISDGTTSGTILLKDIKPGAEGSNPGNFAVFNNKLYFTAADDVHGLEVWETDGTPAGTQLYHEFTAGSNGSGASYIGSANGKLFVRAAGKLWATDGPEANLLALANAAPGFSSERRIANGPTNVYFVDGNDALWVSDGTTTGTLKLKDSPSSFAYYSHMTVIEDKLYYGFGPGSYGTEPWVSDGTPAGTLKLREMVAGEFDGGSPTYFIAYKGFVYFRGRNELWRTDGTVSGTTLFRGDFEPFGNINFEGKWGLIFKDVLYFAGNINFGSNGEELWKCDGTTGGTALFKDINSGFISSAPSLLVDGRDGNFYFNAYTGNSDYALWKSNGTANGTVKVADPYPGDNAENLWAIIPVGNTLFYVTASAANGNELWKYSITTDTREPQSQPQIGAVSPNPASDFIRVTLEENTVEPTVLRLFDALGRVVLEQTLDTGATTVELSTQRLTPGQYVLQLQNEKGRQVVSLIVAR